MKICNIFLFSILFICSCSLDSGVEINDFTKSSSVTSTESLNGSYSQLLTVGDYLYGITDNDLVTYDISDKSNLKLINEEQLNFNLESIYHFKGLLFIGSATDLYIYEINNAGVPKHKSTTAYDIETEQITFCDPVVANEKYAYVTLSSFRERTACGEFVSDSHFRIYDIENVETPRLLSSYAMENPKGLAIVGNTLFICDDYAGLKVYDVTDPLDAILLQEFDGITAYDAIARDNLLTVVGKNQVRQYDYTDIKSIKYLGAFDF